MGFDKESVSKIRGLIVFTVVVAVIGVNYHRVLGIAAALFGMLFPFIIGGGIAFVLNVPMRWIERVINRKRKYQWSRGVSLILAVFFVIGVISVVMVVVGPELVRTVSGLQESLPHFFMTIQRKFEKIFAENPDILVYIRNLEVDWEQMVENVIGFIKNGAGTVLDSTFSAMQSLVSGVTSVFIGCIFAIYILLQKENLARQCKKLISAFLPDKTADWLIRVARLTERTFSSFMTGQCLEAVILGAMFFVTLTLLQMPYALLIGVLIGFTALIPMVGAFIGCAVGAFLILLVNPMQALIFVGVFLLLQQIEGNLIYPHVVGNSVGLPSIWVLVAVTLGGSMMGVLGMLVFIPLVSVCYALLREEVNRRLERKKR
ncbi:MAG: AI-2E family transporter [Brotaphodocola sp.]